MEPDPIATRVAFQNGDAGLDLWLHSGLPPDMAGVFGEQWEQRCPPGEYLAKVGVFGPMGSRRLQI